MRNKNMFSEDYLKKVKAWFIILPIIFVFVLAAGIIIMAYGNLVWGLLLISAGAITVEVLIIQKVKLLRKLEEMRKDFFKKNDNPK